jgi:hypothetical protein
MLIALKRTGTLKRKFNLKGFDCKQQKNAHVIVANVLVLLSQQDSELLEVSLARAKVLLVSP